MKTIHIRVRLDLCGSLPGQNVVILCWINSQAFARVVLFGFYLNINRVQVFALDYVLCRGYFMLCKE